MLFYFKGVIQYERYVKKHGASEIINLTRGAEGQGVSHGHVERE
jgi:hypothetical protein